MKWFLTLVLFAVALPTQALAQVSLPSKEEVGALVSKADEKISDFEEALRNAKLLLDKTNPQTATNYLKAATADHTLARTLQKNGPTAYALVGLMATLDDLSLDAAKASLQLLGADEANVLKGAQPNAAILVSITSLSSAGNACNDISELILHATLRYINAEEELLGQLLEKQK